MTDLEIQNDRNNRVEGCKAALEKVLKEFQFAIIAEDNWTPNTKIRVEISFVDLKKYDAAIAEKDKPVAETVAAIPEGQQSDGGVVINKESLK